MKTPQEQAEKHPPTECCNYAAPLTLPYPVMWNEFNKVVQCHNCGHVWTPKLPELIAVARAAIKYATGKSIQIQMQGEFEMLMAIDALRATGKIEL